MVIGYVEEYNERMSKTMNKATENVGEIEVKEQENHQIVSIQFEEDLFFLIYK